MATFAVMMVRDEADVIEGTLRHMADEVDHVIVADNLSTDETPDILHALADELPLTLLEDPDPAYEQSRKMSALAAAAADQGATWIVPADADEVWYGPDRLSVVLRQAKRDVVTARLFNHFPSAVDPAGKDPFDTIIWRQPHPAPLPKVAFRWEPGAIVHQGNHGVTLSDSRSEDLGLEIRHFPYRSPEQFIRKARNGAAAYAATNLPEHEGAHWRGYGRILAERGEDALREVFERYFWALSPADEGWTPSPAPYLRWQRQSPS